MRVSILWAGVLAAGLLGVAQAQDEDVGEDWAPPLDPLAQCLEIGNERYARCTAEIDTDSGECLAESDSYREQCYELNP